MSAKPRRALVDVESTRVVAPLAILVTCALLVLMQLYLAIPLAPVLAADLRSGGAAVALGTVYSLAYGLGFLIFGPLSDRYGRKAVLVPGMVALAVATAALSLVSSMALVGVLRAVQGLLAASFAAVALAYVGEGLPRRWRSTGVGAVATAFLVAGILGQVLGLSVTPKISASWASSQNPHRGAAISTPMRAQDPERLARRLLTRPYLADTQRGQLHPVGVEHPVDVVVGGDQQ